MPRLTFPRLVPVLLVLALGVSACGGSDDAEQADATVSQPTQPRTQETLPATTPTVPTTPATVPTVPTTPQTTATTPPPATTPTTPDQNGGATQPRELPATTPSEQSGGAATPASCGDVANGFISGVQASGAECGEATGVANAWLGSVGDSGPEGDVVAAGYACSGSRQGDSTVVTCIADGGRRVTFSANN